MTTENTDSFQDDYDSEWSQDEDSASEPQEENLENVEETPEENQADSEGAQEQAEEPTSEPPTDTEAQGGQEQDIWAGASPEARAEFEKTQRDLKAMNGRTKSERERNSLLETENKRLAQKLEDATRTPTKFETDHPDLAKDTREIVRQEAQKLLTEKSSEESENQTKASEEEAFETILKVHPDAGDIWNSQDFQSWLQEQPLKTVTLLNSEDPQDTITVLDNFNQSLAQVAQNEQKEQLDSLAEPDKSSPSKPDVRGSKTFSEQYDDEWARDDI